jgi:hypothetical protein
MKYAVRYAALAMAMLSGTVFLSGVLRLLRTYDYTQHRFAPAHVSRSETLFVGITCVAFARIYQLMVGSKSDPISKTQTEIELAHVGFLVAWFCSIFMVHKMNLPNRSVSSWILVAFVLATVYAIIAGFTLRKRFFRQSAEALPSSVRKAVGLWRGAHSIGFTFAMSIAIWGVVLKFLGSNWYQAGTFFGVSLGLLLLWRPRQLAATSAQPAL